MANTLPDGSLIRIPKTKSDLEFIKQALEYAKEWYGYMENEGQNKKDDDRMFDEMNKWLLDNA